jgi:hypothetical protein
MCVGSSRRKGEAGFGEVVGEWYVVVSVPVDQRLAHGYYELPTAFREGDGTRKDTV